MKDFERGRSDTIPTVAIKGAFEVEWGFGLAKVEEVGVSRSKRQFSLRTTDLLNAMVVEKMVSLLQ